MSDFHVQQIDHVELFVPDQEAAAAWYGEVFGLTVVEEFRFWAEDGPLMLTTREGGTKLALFRGEPETAVFRAAFRRVAFRVDGDGFLDFLSRLEHLDVCKDHGAQLTSEDVVDHQMAMSIYFVDPWRHRFEITTYDHVQVRTALEC